MKNWTVIQARYLQQPLALRLNHLADRLLSLAQGIEANQDAETLRYWVEESKHFIEWTALETGVTHAATLLDLQIQLTRWQLLWSRIEADPPQYQEVAVQATLWAERVHTIAADFASPLLGATGIADRC